MIAKPVFVINFKTYEQGYGEAGIKLAKTIEEVAKIKALRVIICVPATEISRVAAAVKIPVYAQHADPFEPGQHTGWLPPKLLVAAGAKGTLINHSEHRIDDVEKAVAASHDAGLEVIVCAKDAMEVKIFRNLPVQFIAVEPPELIGGDIPIEKAHPEIITHSVKHCPDKLLVGAGITSKQDVMKSVELGAKGVLIASHIVKAKNAKEKLLEFFTGW